MLLCCKYLYVVARFIVQRFRVASDFPHNWFSNLEQVSLSHLGGKPGRKNYQVVTTIHSGRGRGVAKKWEGLRHDRRERGKPRARVLAPASRNTSAQLWLGLEKEFGISFR